jgi:hypothetical protein
MVRTKPVLVSSVRLILRCLRSRRSMRAGRRVHAALAAAMFVVASLLGIVHEATTTHVRCAAHGELVDSAAPVGAVAGPARDAIDRAAPLSRAHGDEHCLLASALRESRIAPRAPAIAAVAVAVDDVAVVVPSAVPAPAGLYRIAPKTSPPA